MARARLDWQDISTRAAIGGYATGALMSDTSALIVLSILASLNQRYNWHEMSDEEWDECSDMVARAQGEVMGNFMVGVIAPLYTDTAPDGWLACDGSFVDVADYPELAMFLGKGPPLLVFQLPNLESVVIRQDQNQPLGTYYGADKITLTVGQLPPHDHTHLYPTAQPLIAGAPESILTGFTAPAITRRTGDTGAGEPVGVIQRSISVPYYIFAGR